MCHKKERLGISVEGLDEEEEEEEAWDNISFRIKQIDAHVAGGVHKDNVDVEGVEA